LVRKAIVIDPSVNAVVVSGLAPGTFHETTEGLGVLLQLPPYPEKSHGEAVLNLLGSVVIRLRNKRSPSKGLKL
jgi:hypothetical protein